MKIHPYFVQDEICKHLTIMGTKLGKKIKSESKQTVKITAEEYSLIKAIWTRIEFEPKVHGTGFYLRLFSKYPQYIKYFLTDPGQDYVNPDALMVVKFTVIIEILGYLILDFRNKPKQFNRMIGHLGMMHKDMNLDFEDTNNFCTSLIDYLKDVMSDLMTDACEAVFVTFFRNIQELMLKSIAQERKRFDEEIDNNHDDNEKSKVLQHSRLKALVPCAWSEHSTKLIYGQPREYWILRQEEWKWKLETWEQENQVAPALVNFQNNVESTSSDDDGVENVKMLEESDPEVRSNFPGDENRSSFLMSRAKYSNTGRLVSVPYFEHRHSEFVDFGETNDFDESYLMNNADGNSVPNVKLTPRERHRAEAAAVRSLHPRPSGRLISSTDTGSPRYSDGSSTARERRRSTWN